MRSVTSEYELGPMDDSLTRYLFIHRLRDLHLRKVLNTGELLKFAVFVQRARQIEATLVNDTRVLFETRKHSGDTTPVCINYLRHLAEGRFPARSKLCGKCQRKGHSLRACKNEAVIRRDKNNFFHTSSKADYSGRSGINYSNKFSRFPIYRIKVSGSIMIFRCALKEEAELILFR